MPTVLISPTSILLMVCYFPFPRRHPLILFTAAMTGGQDNIPNGAPTGGQAPTGPAAPTLANCTSYSRLRPEQLPPNNYDIAFDNITTLTTNDINGTHQCIYKRGRGLCRRSFWTEVDALDHVAEEHLANAKSFGDSW